MNVFENLLQLIRRPTAALPAPAAPEQGRPVAETPATDAELADALDVCCRERMAALALIASAGDRREALLLQPGSDAAIEQIEREVSAANLLVERLERIEPEMQMRLSNLRDQARVDRWVAVRNGYIAAGRAHVAALDAVQLDVGAYNAVRRRVLEEFGAAEKLLPRFPFLPPRAAADLAAALDRLGTIIYNPRPGPGPRALVSLAELQERGLDHLPGGFPESTPQPKSHVRIRLKIPRQIGGLWHPAGVELDVDIHTAEAERAAGAVLVADVDQGAL